MITSVGLQMTNYVQLENAERLPGEVIPILEKHLQIHSAALGNIFVGMYVHGSIALGDFDFRRSDLDYLAIISDPLTNEQRGQLAESFLKAFDSYRPPKGIEMSIVLERFAGDGFYYPTPYEFHFGTREQIKHHSNAPKAEATDPDLAAHFTITSKCGIKIFGKPIEEVFTPVPRQDYLASIILDSVESYKSIMEKTKGEECKVPDYAVLNFCRVIAYIETNTIYSKSRAGEWALGVLPEEFKPVILAAVQERNCPGSSERIRGGLLKDFADFAHQRIQVGMQQKGK